MEINIKIIDSDFNTETGISTTKILTDLGSFTGTAKLHPDDQDKASRFAGCRYAEIRATIKYMKMKKKLFKEEIKLLNHLLGNTKNKISRKNITEITQNLANDIQECNKNIELLKKSLTATIEKREEFVNKEH